MNAEATRGEDALGRAGDQSHLHGARLKAKHRLPGRSLYSLPPRCCTVRIEGAGGVPCQVCTSRCRPATHTRTHIVCIVADATTHKVSRVITRELQCLYALFNRFCSQQDTATAPSTSLGQRDNTTITSEYRT